MIFTAATPHKKLGEDENEGDQKSDAKNEREIQEGS